MRHISLLLQNGTEEDLNKIKNWCLKNDIGFEYRYGRKDTYAPRVENDELSPLYYFYIIGNTSDYIKLQNEMNGKLQTTDYAEICNVADLDDDFEKELVGLLDSLQTLKKTEYNISQKFLNFIKKTKNLKLLKEFSRYSILMNDHQKQLLRDRIDIVAGKKKKVHEEFTEEMKAIHNDVKLLRKRTGMNRKQFCEYFEIPYRTVEDWENKKSLCSTYLYDLMTFKLESDGKLD